MQWLVQSKRVVQPNSTATAVHWGILLKKPLKLVNFQKTPRSRLAFHLLPARQSRFRGEEPTCTAWQAGEGPLCSIYTLNWGPRCCDRWS